ncbi:MAG: C4-dicarboxylate ABC transporter substrate-binding protein [Pseudomonadota bacterium]
MSRFKHIGRNTLWSGLAAMVFGLTAPAYAQDVTLRSADGLVNLTGEIVEFDGERYVIQSQLGPLNVSADYVECFGDACPSNDPNAVFPVTWSVSLWGSRRAFTEHVEKLGELLAERTDGNFRLNISYGGLSPSRENLDGIANGAFEMAQFCAGYHPDKNPSITVLELPFLGVQTMEQEMAVSRAIYRHPAVVADLARWNATLLMPTPQPQYNIAGAGSPPTSLESFQEMTIRAAGGTGDAVEALGAASVVIPAPGVQEALLDGEINAVAFAPHAHMAFGTIESSTWWTTNLNPGTANCPVVVNSDALERLPMPYRIALLSSIDEALQHFITNYESSTMSEWETVLKDRSIIELTFADGFLDVIKQEVAAPAAQRWIAENEARGLPASEIYELLVATLENQS